LRAVIVTLSAELTNLPDNINKPLPVDGKVGAWVCEGRRCLPEIQQLENLLAVMSSSNKPDQT
jgi:uncharacterized protein YyaL (SSP411 family)